ncbi:MAG: hypothetical protein ABIC04_04910 [Nanoarchaeota archaeon]
MYDIANNSDWGDNNFTLYVDTVEPESAIYFNDSTVEFGSEHINIGWNVSDLNQDYVITNVTYPNGSLLASSNDEYVNFTFGPANLTMTGLYTVKVWVNDSAGNINYSIATFSVVDTTPPNATLVSPINASWSNSSNVTFTCNATNMQLRNVSLWNNIYGEWKINQTKNITGRINSTSFNVSNIPDNNTGYLWNCLVYDIANNSDWGDNNFTLYVDTVEPESAIYFNDSIIEFGSEHINVGWNVSDLNQDYVITNVTYPNGSLLASSNDEYVNFTFGPANLTLTGFYTVKVWVNDSAGNINYSIVTFSVVDTTPPNATLISPINASWSNSSNVTFTCNATNMQLRNISLWHNIDGEWKLNQTKNITGRINSTSFNVSNIPDNNTGYLWNCLVYDIANNSDWGDNNFTLYVDTVEPESAIYFNDSIIEFGSEHINIGWNVSDLNQDYVITNITFPNGSLLASSNDEYVNFTFGPANLTMTGLYTVKVWVNDSAGNINYSIATFSVVDTTPPNATLISPINASWSNSSNVTFVCNATNMQLRNISLWHNIDGKWKLNQTKNITGRINSTSFNVSNIPDNNTGYLWNCLVYDIANNSDWGDNNFTLYVDTVKPMSEIYFNDSIIEFGSEHINVGWNVSDLNQDYVITNVTYPNGSLLASSNDEYVNFTFGPANLTMTGLYTVKVWVNDSAGNINYSIATFRVVDTTPPNATLISPINASWSNSSNVTFVCNATNMQLRNISLWHNIDGKWKLNQTKNITGRINSTTFNVSNIPDNNTGYLWNCLVYDIANNSDWGDNNFTLYVDTVKPTSAIYFNDSTIEFGSEHINIGWNVSDLNQDYVITNVTFPNGSLLASSNDEYINFTFSPANLTLTGFYTVKVWVNDSAGNINYSVKIFSVFDTTPPITLISPSNSSWSNSSNITFVCNASDMQLKNISMWHNIDGVWKLNQTKNITGTENSSSFNVSLIPDNYTGYLWNCLTYDVSSNFAWAKTNYTFYVDTIEPESTISFNDSIIEFGSKHINVGWNVSDLNQDYVITNVTYPNGSLLASSNDEYVNFTFGPANLIMTGLYTVKVWVNDSAGNINYSMATFSVVDTTPPNATLVSPINASWSNSSNVTFVCNATNMQLRNISLWHNIDGIWKLNQTKNITGRINSTSFNVSNIPDNNTGYLWNCLVYDIANNSDWGDNNFTLYVDTISPTISYIYPTQVNNTNQSSTTVVINVSHLEINPDTIILYWNNSQNVTKSYIGDYTNFTLLNLKEGNYSYYVWLNDTVGHSNQTEVRYFTVDWTPPLINLISPDNNTWDTNGFVLFEYIVTDTRLNIDNCSLVINNKLNKTNLTVAEGVTQNFSLELLGGSYNWSINCTDSAGNTNSSEIRIVKVDFVPPMINLESPALNFVWITSHIVTFEYNTTDAVANVTNCSLIINNKLNQTNGSITENVTQSFTGYFRNAKYNWSVNCTDESGNTNSSVQYNLTVAVPDMVLSAQRSRVFYQDGTEINLTINATNTALTITANFTEIDSEYSKGDETVYEAGNNIYYINYTISSGNSRANNDIVNGVHYRIPIYVDGVFNYTINVSLKNGEWEYGFVNYATDCSGGIKSNYFEENTDCATLFYDSGEEEVVPDYYVDKYFAYNKYTDSYREFICNDGIDEEVKPSTGGIIAGADGADCADPDCAGIYYYCPEGTSGWRDDPPKNLGVPECDIATNLCSGSIGTAAGGTLTYFYYTYNIAPTANFSIRFFGVPPPAGESYYIKVGEFNETIDITDDRFRVLNATDSSGFNDQSLATSSTSVRASTNSQPFTNSLLNVTFQVSIPASVAARGNQTIRLDRNIESDTKDMNINYNISDAGMVNEKDVSCSDSHDNDLDYFYDCADHDCDLESGNIADPDDLCQFANESKNALVTNDCMDGFDNDADNTYDCKYDPSKRDDDCNNTYIINASWDSFNKGSINGTCQFDRELNCSDGFDNDRDRMYDCNVKPITNSFDYDLTIDYSINPTDPLCAVSNTETLDNNSYADAEYNCGSYCRSYNKSNESSVIGGCLDGKDNDWDFYNLGTCNKNTTTGGVDCRMIEYDTDCNNTLLIDGLAREGECQLVYEVNCTDGFDNDRDGVTDCSPTDAGGDGIPEYRFNTDSDGEYDCSGQCKVENATENTTAQCTDNIDNDLDYWIITGWSGTQYTAIVNTSGGMDCRYNYDGSHYADPSCNGTIVLDENGNLGECQLGHETNCSDGVDNDMDRDYNAGADRQTGVGGYDCDDYDCIGTPSCPFNETANLTNVYDSTYTPDISYDIYCMDGIDNDLDRYEHSTADYLLDSNRVVNTSGGIDCVYNYGGIRPSGTLPYINSSQASTMYTNYLADRDCNNSPIGNSTTNFARCELQTERNCTDSFDNDQDFYVSEYRTHVGTDVNTANWSRNVNGYNAYFASSFAVSADCDDYSCSGDPACPDNESYDMCKTGNCDDERNWCLDGVDNDLDYYAANGYSAGTGGIDCRWTSYDPDCNNSLINDSYTEFVGYCQIRKELDCSDNVDNDQDGYVYNTTYRTYGADGLIGNGTDCDDYDCSRNPSCPLIETICDDSIDNDLDKYFWNGTGYELNTTSGTDCSDVDCEGLAGPGGMLCALSEFGDTLCGDYNDTYFASDNDDNGPANCYDSGCYHQGTNRICTETEDISIDSCADTLDNEIVYQYYGLDELYYAANNKNSSILSDTNYYNQDGSQLADCSDPDCAGKIGPTQLCGVSETDCGNNLDDDFDSYTDCEDSDCIASCPADPDNTVEACSGALNCNNDALIDAVSDSVPVWNITGDFLGSADIIFSQIVYRGQNVTFRIEDYDGCPGGCEAQGDPVAIVYGAGSHIFPAEFNATSENSDKYGTEAASYTLLVADPGEALIDPQLDYTIGIYPNQAVNISYYVTLPYNDIVTMGSPYDIAVSISVEGDTPPSKNITIYVLETEKPIIDFVKPINNSIVKRIRVGDKVELKANATDNNGGYNSGIDFCQFNYNNAWENEDSPYNCRYNITLADGTHAISGRAVDGVGNIGDNQTVNITLITIPRQDDDFYCANTTGNCSNNYPLKNYFNNSQILEIGVNFTSDVIGFTDNASGCTVKAENATSVIVIGNVSLDAQNDNKVAVCTGNVSLSGLASGSYYITVQVIDDNHEYAISGENPWNDGHSKERIWVCDYIKTPSGWTCKTYYEQYNNTAPRRVTLLSPANNTGNDNRTPLFSWTGSWDANGDNYKYFMEIDDDDEFGSMYISQNVSVPYYRLTKLQNLSDKIWYWRVKTCDNSSAANNCSYSTKTWILNIDNRSPEIFLESPENGSVWATSSTVIFRYNVTDNTTITNCSLIIDGQVNDTHFSIQTSTSESFIIKMPDGSYEWGINCTDVAGNENSSVTYSLIVDINETPRIKLNAPNNNSWSNVIENLFYYTPNDLSGIANCTLVINGSMNATNSTPVINGALNSLVTNLSEGVWSWTVNCTDINGEEGTNTSIRILSLDFKKPNIVLNAPVNGTNTSSSLNFNWTVIDDKTNSTCNITIDSITAASNIDSPNNISTNYSMSNYLTGGTHIWGVVCWDSAGNLNYSVNYSITVVAGPENVTISLRSDFSIIINWSNASYADSYSIYYANNYTGEFVPIATGITDLNWTDIDAETFTQRFYKVATGRGNVYANGSVIVGKYDVELVNSSLYHSGWNLISIPFSLNNWELYNGTNGGYEPHVQPAQCITSMWRYNGTTGWERTDNLKGNWTPAAGDENFTSLEAGRGYWFEVNTSCNLTFVGQVPTINKDISLLEGYNIVGWHSPNSSDLLISGEPPYYPVIVDPVNSVAAIDRYNAESNTFELIVHYDSWGWWPSAGNPGFTTLDPTTGYYFDVSPAATWQHDPNT